MLFSFTQHPKIRNTYFEKIKHDIYNIINHIKINQNIQLFFFNTTS